MFEFIILIYNGVFFWWLLYIVTKNPHSADDLWGISLFLGMIVGYVSGLSIIMTSLCALLGHGIAVKIDRKLNKER